PLGTRAAAEIGVTQNFSGFVPRFISCQHLGIADGQLFLFAIAFEMANPALPAAGAQSQTKAAQLWIEESFGGLARSGEGGFDGGNVGFDQLHENAAPCFWSKQGVGKCSLGEPHAAPNDSRDYMP